MARDALDRKGLGMIRRTFLKGAALLAVAPAAAVAKPTAAAQITSITVPDGIWEISAQVYFNDHMSDIMRYAVTELKNFGPNLAFFGYDDD